MIIPSPAVFTGALQDQRFTLPAPGVLANATAPTGFTVRVHNYSQPTAACAAVAVSDNGALDVQPSLRFVGDCSFLFFVLDQEGALTTAIAVVVIGEGQHTLCSLLAAMCVGSVPIQGPFAT